VSAMRPGEAHAAAYRTSLAAGSDRRTLAELGAEGYASIAVYCPHCRAITHTLIEGLRRATRTKTLKEFELGLRCRRCGGRPARGWVKPGRKLAASA
jgi:ribosomal protein L44E